METIYCMYIDFLIAHYIHSSEGSASKIMSSLYFSYYKRSKLKAFRIMTVAFILEIYTFKL